MFAFMLLLLDVQALICTTQWLDFERKLAESQV